MRKYVTNVHSTKAVIECGLENDWMFINVRAVAGAAESTAISIDVERSKKFVQNTVSFLFNLLLSESPDSPFLTVLVLIFGY